MPTDDHSEPLPRLAERDIPYTIRSAAPHHWLCALLLLITFVQMAYVLGAGRVHSNDFKHLWLGPRIFAQGGNPYDADDVQLALASTNFGAINPYVYPPSTALLMRPFTLLPFPSATLVWFVFNLLLVWWAVWRGPILMRCDRIGLARTAGFCFLIGALPFYRQMTAGQMNCVLLAAIVFALGALVQGRMIHAGIALGLATAFKLTPGLLVLGLLATRNWKAFMAAVGTFVGVSLVAELWAGAGAHLSYLPMLSEMGYGKSTWSEFGMDFYRDPYNQSVNALLHHLTTQNPHTDAPFPLKSPALANGLSLIAGLGMLIASLLLVGRSARRSNLTGPWKESNTVLMLILSLFALLIPSLMWDHYAVQVLPGLMWVLGSRITHASPAKLLAALIAFGLLVVPIFHTAPEFLSGPGILMMSIRLWGTLLVLGLLLMEYRERLRHPLPEAGAT